MINNVDPIYQYYNAEIVGSNIIDTKAIFSVNRTDWIIQNPSDYYIGIEDFSIPLQGIPMFIFKDLTYKFKLEYDGLLLTEYLILTPESNLPNNYVFSYQSMINSMNIALKLLYDNMLIAKPLFSCNEQPFVTLQDNLITINLEDQYLISGTKLFCNDSLYEFLRSINIYFFNFDQIEFVYYDWFPTYIRNGNVYYRLTQGTQEIENWNRLQSIVFETSTVPVSSENVGTQENIELNILGDFLRIPTPQKNGFFDYNNKGIIPLINLNSSYPMTQVDIIVRWFFNDFTSGIIIVPFSTIAQIKLVLVKRQEENKKNINQEGLLFG